MAFLSEGSAGEFVISHKDGNGFGKMARDSQGNSSFLTNDKNGNSRRMFLGETSSVHFNNTFQAHVTFSPAFPSVPRVFLQLDSGAPGMSVKPINVTINGFDIKASANYTGIVGYSAIVV